MCLLEVNCVQPNSKNKNNLFLNTVDPAEDLINQLREQASLWSNEIFQDLLQSAYGIYLLIIINFV